MLPGHTCVVPIDDGTIIETIRGCAGSKLLKLSISLWTWEVLNE